MSKYNLLFNVNTIHLCWQVPFINVFKIYKKKSAYKEMKEKKIKIQKELLSLSNEKHKIIIIILIINTSVTTKVLKIIYLTRNVDHVYYYYYFLLFLKNNIWLSLKKW